jgi:DNA-binding transcriptional MerR regulator
MKKYRLIASTVLAGMALTFAGRGAFADDPQPKKTPQPRITKVQGGVLRIVGPDGKIHEQKFHNLREPQIDELLAKLKELQAAAGDQEKVEQVTKDLLKQYEGLATRINEAPGVETRQLPKFGVGVSLSPEVPAALRAQLKLDENQGVLVQSVAEDSPADKAGLKEFDLLLAVNGEVIDAHSDLVDAVQKAGEEKSALSLDYVSGGEHKSVKLTPTPSGDIVWAFVGGGEHGPFINEVPGLPGAPGRALTLRMPPGVVSPNFVTPDGQNIPHLQLMAPFANQQQLEQRIDQLEQKLDEIAEKLSQQDEK